MDLRELRFFVAVEDEGSFAKAAAKLNVAQSAVSLRIKRLEDTLGADLFVRSATGSRLTPSGVLLLGHARAILDRVAQATSEVSRESRPADILVQLGIPSGAGRVLTIPILKAVQTDLPGTTVRVVEALSGDLEQQLELGHLDLSLLFRPAGGGRARPGSEEPLYLVAARGPGGRQGPRCLTLEELSRIELTMPTARHQVRRFLVEAAEREHVSLRITREIDSNARIMDLVLDESASSVMLASAFIPEWQAGKIDARRVSNVDLERVVVMAPCREKHRSATIEAVRQLVSSVADTIVGRSAVSMQRVG